MTDLPFFDPLLEPPPLPRVDRLPVRGATVDMIDLDKVRAHIDHAASLTRLDDSTPRDVLAYLARSDCLVTFDDDTSYPTLAGLLCFGRNPQQLLRWAVVDLAHYRGVKPLSYELLHLGKNIGGTIFDQLEYVRRYLWTYTQHGMTVTDSFQRVDVHEYPEVVLRELGVNMLAHRDYTITTSQARVMLFRNRIEWANPGGLPEGVTPENILRQQHSRNPSIQSILYEAGYVEALGQGLDTVVAALQQDGAPPQPDNPTFEDLRDTFIVTIRGRALADVRADGAFADLSKHQRRILEVLQQHDDVSSTDVMRLLDRSESAVLRDLRVLIKTGLVDAIGDARARRYVLAAPLRPPATPAATVHTDA